MTGKRQLILSVLQLLLIAIPHLPLQPDARPLRFQHPVIQRQNCRSHLQRRTNKLPLSSAVLTLSINIQTKYGRGLDSSGSWEGKLSGFYEHCVFMNTVFLCTPTLLATAYPCRVFRIKCVRFMPSHLVSLIPTLIQYFNPLLGLSSCLFPLGSYSKPCMHFSSPRTRHTSRPLHPSWLQRGNDDLAN